MALPKYGLLSLQWINASPHSGRNSDRNSGRNSGLNSGWKSKWLYLSMVFFARNELTLLPISGPVSGQIYCNIVIRIDLPSRPTRWKKKLKIRGVTPKTQGNNLDIKVDIEIRLSSIMVYLVIKASDKWKKLTKLISIFEEIWKKWETTLNIFPTCVSRHFLFTNSQP